MEKLNLTNIKSIEPSEIESILHEFMFIDISEFTTLERNLLSSLTRLIGVTKVISDDDGYKEIVGFELVD